VHHLSAQVIVMVIDQLKDDWEKVDNSTAEAGRLIGHLDFDVRLAAAPQHANCTYE
jgi:hypothetical protein